MKTYVLKRVLLMIPTLVGITFLAYAIIRLAPGDPVEAMIRKKAGDLNPQVFAKEAAKIRERLGLIDPNLWGDDVEEAIGRLKEGQAAAASDLVRMTDIDARRTPEMWSLWWEDRHPRTLIGRLQEAHGEIQSGAETLAGLTGRDFGLDVGAWRTWWDEQGEAAWDERADEIDGAVEALEDDAEELAEAEEAGGDEADRGSPQGKVQSANADLQALTGVDLPPDSETWRRWLETNYPPKIIKRMTEAEKRGTRAAQRLARLWSPTDFGLDPAAWKTWWSDFEPTFKEKHQQPFTRELEQLEAAVEKLAVVKREAAAAGSAPASAGDVDSPGVAAAEEGVAAEAEDLESLVGVRLNASPRAWQVWWEENRFRLHEDYIDAGERAMGVVIGYARWLGNVVTGDLGESMQETTKAGSRDPAALFFERAQITIPLNVAAQILIFFIAIPVGLLSAQYHGRWFDRGATVVLLLFWSIPHILAGTLLIGYLGEGGKGLEWFPVAHVLSSEAREAGMGSFLYWKDLLLHVTLPVMTLVYGGLAYLSKLGRASLLENLRADYIRTARAKGLSERRVVYHHALRNSLLPMITTMVMMLPALLAGSVIVERLYTLKGMGSLMVAASQQRDLAVIMFGTLVFGVLTLLSLLVGDILYAWADPRVRYD